MGDAKGMIQLRRLHSQMIVRFGETDPRALELATEIDAAAAH
jgi:hypothetical protein